MAGKGDTARATELVVNRAMTRAQELPIVVHIKANLPFVLLITTFNKIIIFPPSAACLASQNK